ncbi:MAG: GSU2403 family nucleotidyltransferase fold protein [Pseudomonadota bacterium]
MEIQHKLVMDLLRRLSAKGILDHVLLVGSWCAHFYKEYFSKVEYHSLIRTRDIDFLLPVRFHMATPVDLEQLLSPLGFEVEFYGKGYMKLESDDLAIEFLAPEIGPSKEKPHPMPGLHLNAQPLRHMMMLWRDPVEVSVEDIRLLLPHPADYSLQKLVVSGKRRDAGKRAKDVQSASLVIDALLETGDAHSLRHAYKNLSKSEKTTVSRALRLAGYKQLDIELSKK